MRQKWWRKEVPKDDGMVNYNGSLVTPEMAKNNAELVMKFAAAPLWHKDPSYNWRKRRDTATRLQVNKRT